MSAIVALGFEVGGVVLCFEVGGVVVCLGGALAMLLNLFTAPPPCAVACLCGCGCGCFATLGWGVAVLAGCGVVGLAGCGCFATLGCEVAGLCGCVIPMFWLNCEKLSLPDFPSV